MKEEKIKITENDSLFTIGAFIKPVKVIINNKEQWRWVVISFEDSTFYDGEEINLYTYADRLEGLIIPEKD